MGEPISVSKTLVVRTVDGPGASVAIERWGGGMVHIEPGELRALVAALCEAAGLLAQGAAATAPPGTSWAFGCTLGLAQEDCGAYLADTNSRGAAAGLGGCPSCTHREPDNAKTRMAETAAGLVLPRRAYRSGVSDG